MAESYFKKSDKLIDSAHNPQKNTVGSAFKKALEELKENSTRDNADVELNKINPK